VRIVRVRAARQWIAALGLLGALATPCGAHHMDSANTQVAFEIHHLGLRWFTAAFHDLSGEFELDPDGQGGQLTVVVGMASIDCDSAFWDERLRSPQWFDTAKFPHMVYRSSRIDFQGPTRATVHGDLTLHGITRPVTLAVTDIDCPQTRGDGAARCRFLGHAQLKRSDFGLAHAFWQGGDSVDIIVHGS
jgi:polyisoprenoid-binding protein YceI